MEQTRESDYDEPGGTVVLAVARRDEVRVARRLYRKPLVDGVYPLDAAAWQERLETAVVGMAGLTSDA